MLYQGKYDTKNGTTTNRDEGFIAVVEVYVHQARVLETLCVYHKQDVYAKLYLANDPEKCYLHTDYKWWWEESHV